MHDLEGNKTAGLGRRELLSTAGAAMVASAVAAGPALAASAPSRQINAPSAAARNNGPLGARLQGVQHFGLTVQNMERAYEFYTGVLGGTEVFRHGDFQGDPVHNTLLADRDIRANELHIDPQTIGVPTARPRHHAQNEQAMEAFKKGASRPNWQRSGRPSRRVLP